MKILKLRFKNLNSLYGEWTIDFLSSALADNGIFAITGPTGAGKSTILDAMCLALYGATPRLGKITKNSNDIMSRHTGECFAEVVFESQAGIYCCHWSQHRARKKPDGKLAEAKHEISDYSNGQLIESKRRHVLNVIEHKTGMDFERFTRSILLAQGGFAAFLQATADERAPILEQITGTEIYSEISIHVHKRHRSEREKLEALLLQAQTIQVLSDKEVAIIKNELKKKQCQESELTLKQSQCQQAIHGLTSKKKIEDEIAGLLQQQQQLTSKLDAFLTHREKLALALKASALEGDYVKLINLRKSLKDEERERVRLYTEQEKHQLDATAAQQALQERQAKLSQQKDQLTLMQPRFNQVRAIDTQLRVSKTNWQEVEREHQQLLNQQLQLRRQNTQYVETITSFESDLKSLHAYLKTHSNDALLESQLSNIATQFETYQRLWQKNRMQACFIKDSNEQISQLSKQCQDALSIEEKKRHSLTQLLTDIASHKKALSDCLGGQLLREYRQQNEALTKEVYYITKINSLEAERDKLQTGSPCPLCGATIHPYANGHLPRVDEVELKLNAIKQRIVQAEKCEQVINDLLKQQQALELSIIGIEKDNSTLNYKMDTEKKKRQNLIDEQQTISAQYDSVKNWLLEKLSMLNLTIDGEQIPENMLDLLTDKHKKWQQLNCQKQQLEQGVYTTRIQQESLELRLKELCKLVRDKEAKLTQLKDEQVQLSQKRYDLLGDTSVDEQEQKLTDDLLLFEQKAHALYAHSEQIQRLLAANQSQVVKTQQTIERHSSAIEQAEENFTHACQSHGFADERMFLKSHLDEQQRSKIVEQQRLLDEEQLKLATRINDCQARRNELDGQTLSTQSLDSLKEQYQQQTLKLKALHEFIGAEKLQLKAHRRAKKQYKQQEALMTAQRKACEVWDKLAVLIGSADGKKFRNFAQGLTFELMLQQANKQLMKMNDRYLLTRDNEQPLALNVIDNFQAGEIRTTKNLSGGESFLVSLALALGLSSMASKNVRVDSLFMDEGFGTLDDDALDSALETLNELQQSGKVIGIISHVGALKERISAQIKVKPESGGKSRIELSQ